MRSEQFQASAEVLAEDLRVGEEDVLDNAALRALFDVGRVTVGLRAEIVDAVRAAGLEVVSDPTGEPLVVRKPQAAPTGARPRESHAGPRAAVQSDPEGGGRKPGRRPVWAAVGALVLLFSMFAALGGGGSAKGGEDEARGESASASSAVAPPPPTTPITETATSVPTDDVATTATPAEPLTLAETEDLVDDDNYAEALAAAALLAVGDRSYIRTRIANRLARRAAGWVRRGRLLRARPLIVELRDYPSTNASRAARRAYFSATERQRQRVARAAAARRRAEVARARARAARFCSKGEKRAYRNAGVVKPGCQSYAAARQAAAARRAEQRRRRAAAAAAPGPSYSDPSVDTSGPSTFNWCGKRDGDGDGIYCE